MRVLTRYLLRAHIGPFLFAFLALTGVILINTLAKELANLAGKGLPMDVVGEFFVLSLPANIALTLPMAVLVAVLHTFSNLAAENEVTALRASGVDLRRATMPLLIAAAMIAGGMIWFSDQVLPAANYRWRVLMTDVAAARPLLALREQTINPIRTSDGRTPYYLEARQLDAETGLMRDVSIYDVSDPEVSRTINADSGRMVFNATRTDLLLTLFDGSMREIDFAEMENFQTVDFERQVMRMNGVSDRLERTAESTFRTDRDMTLAMMRDRIAGLKGELTELRRARSADEAAGDGVVRFDEDSVAGMGSAASEPTDATEAEAEAEAELQPASELALPLQVAEADTGAIPAGAGAGSDSVPEPSAAAASVDGPAEDGAVTPSDTRIIREEVQRYTETRVENIEGQIREYQVEIQKKYSIAVATLVFVLIGIPIALRFPSGGIGMVIGVSLAVFGIYYIGLIGGETLGNRGYVPASLAMWITNIIFGGVGIIGFLRLGREQGTGRGGGWGEMPQWLRSRRALVAEGETG
ncbi:MAG: LptF/LptG family permease [Gemmatimonadota bacterium]